MSTSLPMRLLQRLFLTSVSAFSLLVASGCGGGEEANTQQSTSPRSIETILRSASERNTGPVPEKIAAIFQQKSEVLLQSKTNLVDPGSFFDWAELRFPSLFPSSQTNRVSGDLTFRFYPENELYLAVLSGEVLALGTPTGNKVVSLGPLVNYLCAVFPEVCELPVAVVGPNQSVRVGATVAIDGSKSFDPSGDLLVYQWSILTKPAGSTALLSSNTTAQTILTPDLPGSYVIRLSVTDGELASEAVTVSISASLNNAPPQSVPGVTRSVTTGVAVSLDGSASSDSDGDALSYSWRFTSRPSGSTAALSGSNTARPVFTPDLAGQYVVELVVGDGISLSQGASITLVAANTNAPPTAVPSGSQSATTGSVIFLNGRSSVDPNGDPLTYEWAFVTRPAGSAATLSSPTSATPSFTADFPGSYVVSLIVSDGKLTSSSASVTITAAGTFVAPPRTCCKVCSTGKPCGATCISRSYTCRVGPGCAC